MIGKLPFIVLNVSALVFASVGFAQALDNQEKSIKPEDVPGEHGSMERAEYYFNNPPLGDDYIEICNSRHAYSDEGVGIMGDDGVTHYSGPVWERIIGQVRPILMRENQRAIDECIDRAETARAEAGEEKTKEAPSGGPEITAKAGSAIRKTMRDLGVLASSREMASAATMALGVMTKRWAQKFMSLSANPVKVWDMAEKIVPTTSQLRNRGIDDKTARMIELRDLKPVKPSTMTSADIRAYNEGLAKKREKAKLLAEKARAKYLSRQ